MGLEESCTWLSFLLLQKPCNHHGRFQIATLGVNGIRIANPSNFDWQVPFCRSVVAFTPCGRPISRGSSYKRIGGAFLKSRGRWAANCLGCGEVLLSSLFWPDPYACFISSCTLWRQRTGPQIPIDAIEQKRCPVDDLDKLLHQSSQDQTLLGRLSACSEAFSLFSIRKSEFFCAGRIDVIAFLSGVTIGQLGIEFLAYFT